MFFFFLSIQCQNKISSRLVTEEALLWVAYLRAVLLPSPAHAQLEVMDGSSSDNFEYILQLTKILSAECRANRQERDKVEHLFKRLAKQSYVGYEHLSGNVTPKSRELFNKIATPTEEDKLIKENYDLLKQIELQEYMNNKFWLLINEINEHLSSIRNFMIERKLSGSQDTANFIDEEFTMNCQRLDMSTDVLKRELNVTKEKSALVEQELKQLLEQIDWSEVPKNSREYINLHEQIQVLKNRYAVRFTS
ncbi:FAR3 (YMR052W) [Zygosaccharomyces parabailii]|nr:FAR3 (YMR052W) [Zygosaccharomyces parabailii]